MIEVKFEDIFTQDVDAIVNPANSHMLHGGGLAQVIAYRGGHHLVRESRAQVPVPTGEAIITGAGELPFKAVIHTVGPVWNGDDSMPYWRQNSSEEDPDVLLARAHTSVIGLAAQRGLTSVAFPAVSCGVFRYPVQRAAPVAVRAVREAQREHAVRAVFCLLDPDHYNAFSDALAQEAL